MRAYNHLALDYINAYSKKRKPQAQASIEHVCSMSNISQPDLLAALQQIRSKASICLHFHPYRLNVAAKTTLECLLESAYYKNQFETQISNGSATAYIGGQRDIWENKLFDQLFATHSIPFAERPKYGALDLFRHSDGPSPRFGSCYFVLKPALSQFASFSYMDSYYSPKEKGSLEHFDDILAALLDECFERSYALGLRATRPHQLLERINDHLAKDYSTFMDQAPSGNLNHYIEAQIHTRISLLEDVESLVADASYRNTPMEGLMKALCETYQIDLLWNKGFELKVDAVPDHFRGKAMPKVANEIAENGWINPAVLGKAEHRLSTDETLWQNKEALNGKLQELKYLWHSLVQYGEAVQ